MRRIARGLAVATACLGVVAIGCRKERAAPTRPVAECLSSMQSALEKGTEQEVTSTYYSGCAELFAPCKDAWKQAASVAPGKQLEIVAPACRAAYCPDLSGLSLGICRDGFTPTPAELEKHWPPFLEAVVAREAQGFARDLRPAFLAVYVRATLLGRKEKGLPELPGGPDALGVPVAPAAKPDEAAPSAAPAASSGAPAPSAAPAASAKP